MAASDPTSDVATPTGVLQGVAAYSWDGSAWQPAGRAGPSVATPTGVLQGVAPFSWDGSAWQPTGRAWPGVATPTGVLDGVAVYTWTGSVWTPASGQPTPSTPSGALRGVAAFNWDGSAWQPAGQAGPSVATPTGVLAGVAMFNWTGSAWAATAATAPPSLDLSFMTPGTLDGRITFTRASTGTYFDASGTLQTATTNAPRWDYSPSALTLNGLLIEEARTNGIRNSMMVGAVPGTPGTMPTNWSVSVGAVGLSSQIVGTGTESGIPYIDWRIFGTSTGNFGCVLVPETATSISAATGQAWTGSLYWRVAAGSAAGFASFQMFIRECTATGVNVRDNIVGLTAPTGAGLNSQRAVALVALSGGGTVAMVQPRYICNVTAGAIDLTLRIGGIQLEQGAGASSFNPTSSVAVTRAADVCTTPTSTWFNAAASSLAADFMVAQAPNPSTVNSRSPAALNDGTASNRLVLYGQANNSSSARILASVTGVNTAGTLLGSTAANVTTKIAGAWNGTAEVGSLNGGATASNAVGMPAGLNTLVVGTDGVGAGTSYLNGWVRRVRYWNTALSAAQLQAVTT